MKNYKMGSMIFLILLSIAIWIVSGMLLSGINKWINYPITIIVFITGLFYIKKHYN